MTDVTSLTRYLEDQTQRKVMLRSHRRRSEAASVRRHDLFLEVECHHAFLKAPEKVKKALATFCRRATKQSRARLVDYLEAWANDHPAAPRKRKVAFKTEGSCYDLQQFYTRLNHCYFKNLLNCDITWGRQSQKRRHGILMGSYSSEDKLLRINPALDAEFVPDYVVEAVVHHEMCHAELDRLKTQSQLPPDFKIHLHGPEFKALAGRNPSTAQSKVWEKKNLHRLLKPK